MGRTGPPMASGLTNSAARGPVGGTQGPPDGLTNSAAGTPVGVTHNPPEGLWTCRFSGRASPWVGRTAPNVLGTYKFSGGALPWVRTAPPTAYGLTNSAAGSPWVASIGPPDGLSTYKFSGRVPRRCDERATRWPLELQIRRRGAPVSGTQGPPNGFWT